MIHPTRTNLLLLKEKSSSVSNSIGILKSRRQALIIEFLKTSKKWWLGPILIFLILLSLLVVFTESSALAPFIYSLF